MRGVVPQQAAVIPVRRSPGEIRVCLIRRRTGGRWSIPKGHIEYGTTARLAALAEAHEEAGLLGDTVGNRLGTYEYDKGGVTLTVAVYQMAVQRELPRWAEMRLRERHWWSLDEASALLESHPVSALF